MKLSDYIQHPTNIKGWLLVNRPQWFRDDRKFLESKWKFLNKSALNLDDPKTFNEKLNWLKLYYHTPKITMMADKYNVKSYVSGIIGDEYVVPNYGVWNSVEEIDFNSLPDQFVIKATHDSSGAMVVRNRQTFDKNSVIRHYRPIMNRNWYWPYREWAYKNIKPRIIVDKFLDDHSGHELRDYKFWCFGGKPKVMYCTNKAADVFENFYDMEFKPLDINHGFRRNVPEFDKPAGFELMKELAAKLSQGLPFARVDFFYVDGHVYFGEFTFYDWAGFRPFVSKEWENRLGDWIELPQH